MKTPRVKDFDPDAKVPNLKSTLEHMPSIQKSTTLNTTPLAKKIDRIENTENSTRKTRKTRNKEEIPPVHPVRVVRGARDVPPVPLKRIMKSRWPIDIYQDQYDSLKNIALEERMQGGAGSMSAMIREAIDKLIAERKGKR